MTFPQKETALNNSSRKSKDICLEQATNELFFGVVGHIGSGTSTISKLLKEELQNSGGYEVTIIPARAAISDWAKKTGTPITRIAGIELIEELQRMGDKMREKDHAAVAKALVGKIQKARTEAITPSAEGPAAPDGKKRAYILDSLKHPAEIHLLRHVYGAAFTVIGIVVADEETRIKRIAEKLKLDARDKEPIIQELLDRDRDSGTKHGQLVAETFHLADYFLDNTADRQEHKNYKIPDQLSRLIKIITHEDVMRPTVDETAMYLASAASLESACLSRQVGACLVNAAGEVVATGKNEPPKAGGGVYSETEAGDGNGSCDGRCAYLDIKEKDGTVFRGCSNNREQKRIVDGILTAFEQPLTEENRKKLRDRNIGDLLEFSRAVHAEMAALLTAAKTGRASQGSRMFVTTFPCHYCARHIVCAGIDEVQYIEPYPKSKALSLHFDAISTQPSGWIPPSHVNTMLLSLQALSGYSAVLGETKGSEILIARTKEKKVLFHPFTGVAPRLYSRVFRKDRNLKDKMTGKKEILPPEWADPWFIGRISYIELEGRLSEEPQ